jgi:hypothetical protein
MNMDEDRLRESQRILAHMQAQTEGGAMAAVQRTAKRGRAHFAATDADDADPIEIWGTRIGRGISLILCLGLLAYMGWLVLAG